MSRISGSAAVDSRIPESSAASADVPVRPENGSAAADRRIQESSAVNVENQGHKTFAGTDAEKIKKVYPYRKMRRKSWR
jgi:hypothetical protein